MLSGLTDGERPDWAKAPAVDRARAQAMKVRIMMDELSRCDRTKAIRAWIRSAVSRADGLVRATSTRRAARGNRTVEKACRQGSELRRSFALAGLVGDLDLRRDRRS